MTRPCQECGYPNEPGAAFCGSCGAYLAWADEEQPAVAQPAPGVPRAAAGREHDGREHDGAQTPAGGQAAGTAVTDLPQPPPAGGALAGRREHPRTDGESASTPAGTSGTGDTAAQRLPRPPWETTGAGEAADTVEVPGGVTARQPGTRQPTSVRRRPRPDMPVPEPAAEHANGSLRCPSCQTGNDPARRFCARCGTRLDLGPIPDRPPWWRRWLRRRRTLAAGERPGGSHWGARSRRIGRRLLTLAVVLGVIAVVIVIARDPVGRWVQEGTGAVRRVVLQPEPVNPVAVSASSANPSHPPEAAFDGVTNTFWAEAPPGGGTGPELRAQLQEPVNLQLVSVYSGASGSPEDFKLQPRPRRITLIGGNGEATLELRDIPGAQTFGVDLRGVQELRVRVDDVYEAPGGSAVAITEIELWKAR